MQGTALINSLPRPSFKYEDLVVPTGDRKKARRRIEAAGEQYLERALQAQVAKLAVWRLRKDKPAPIPRPIGRPRLKAVPPSWKKLIKKYSNRIVGLQRGEWTKPSLEAIALRVCWYHEITLEQLISFSRLKRLNAARAHFVKLARKQGARRGVKSNRMVSYGEIGRFLGGRDETTIRYIHSLSQEK